MEHCFSCRSGGRISESNGTPGKEVRFSERNVLERNCFRGRFSVKGTDLSGICAKANATLGRSEPVIIFSYYLPNSWTDPRFAHVNLYPCIDKIFLRGKRWLTSGLILTLNDTEILTVNDVKILLQKWVLQFDANLYFTVFQRVELCSSELTVLF